MPEHVKRRRYTVSGHGYGQRSLLPEPFTVITPYVNPRTWRTISAWRGIQAYCCQHWYPALSLPRPGCPLRILTRCRWHFVPRLPRTRRWFRWFQWLYKRCSRKTPFTLICRMASLAHGRIHHWCNTIRGCKQAFFIIFTLKNGSLGNCIRLDSIGDGISPWFLLTCIPGLFSA